jgi:hypothetical protein
MSEPGDRTRTNTRFGRVLVFVYGVFALSASARAIEQLATHASKAPVAYSLSLFSGIVYVLATYALGSNRRRLAVVTVLVELVGVLVVGATHSSSVPLEKQSVWTGFGSGYGYVPLVLPVVGLWWLWHTRPDARRARAEARAPRR